MPEGGKKTDQRRLTDTARGRGGNDAGFHGNIKTEAYGSEVCSETCGAGEYRKDIGSRKMGSDGGKCSAAKDPCDGYAGKPG